MAQGSSKRQPGGVKCHWCEKLEPYHLQTAGINEGTCDVGISVKHRSEGTAFFLLMYYRFCEAIVCNCASRGSTLLSKLFLHFLLLLSAGQQESNYEANRCRATQTS